LTAYIFDITQKYRSTSLSWSVMGRLTKSKLAEREARPATTAAREALKRVRQDILTGDLAPETKLKMRELLQRYGLGMSPMREALSQLAAEGWVAQSVQRGFRVPALSVAEIQDLAATRAIVEVHALELAMTHGDAAWEDEIVASFHLYAREVERSTRTAVPDSREREDRHHRFHRALLAACPLGTLKTFCDSLYTRMTRYRCILRIRGIPSDNLIEDHRRLMDIVLSRQRETADVLRAHIWQTADIATEVLSASPLKSTPRASRTSR
jgi:DNA-binding GntR family transcriptional regulator